MPIPRYHLGRSAVRDEHIPSGEVPYGDLKTNTIQLVVPAMLTVEPKSVAADSTGTKTIEWSGFTIQTNMLKHLKSARAAVAYTWAPTADGTIQLYDGTAGVVRGESTTKTGGEYSGFETFDVTGLVEGNTMYVRVNITVAGSAGETVTVHKAYLLLTLGVS